MSLLCGVGDAWALGQSYYYYYGVSRTYYSSVVSVG